MHDHHLLSLRMVAVPRTLRTLIITILVLIVAAALFLVFVP